jgi:hypothetical protein
VRRDAHWEFHRRGRTHVPSRGRRAGAKLVPWPVVKFDVRQVEGRSDRLGLDFDLAYTHQQVSANPQGNHYGIELAANGFNTFSNATRDVNSLAFQGSLQGRYYRSGDPNPLPPELRRRVIELLEKEGGEETEADSSDSKSKLTLKEQAELDRFMDLALKNRRFFTYDVHYRFESTQDVEVKQNAFGAGGAFEVPVLANLLDAIPAATRTGPARRPHPVRAYVGVDYVRPQDDDQEPTATLTDSATWRGRIEMAWSTLVLDEYILRASWEAHYLVDAPKAVRDADREFNNFLQAWLKIPLTTEAGVVIKYLSGRMPPTYSDVDVASLGFNFSFP